jgi:hypothetical protein
LHVARDTRPRVRRVARVGSLYALAAVAGCADPAAPLTTTRLTGTFTLASYDGTPLPTLVQTDPAAYPLRHRVWTESFAADGRYTQVIARDNVTEPTTVTFTHTGTYRVAPPDTVVFTFSVGGDRRVFSLNGDRLTERRPSGVFVFERQR